MSDIISLRCSVEGNYVPSGPALGSLRFIRPTGPADRGTFMHQCVRGQPFSLTPRSLLLRADVSHLQLFRSVDFPPQVYAKEMAFLRHPVPGALALLPRLLLFHPVHCCTERPRVLGWPRGAQINDNKSLCPLSSCPRPGTVGLSVCIWVTVCL